MFLCDILTLQVDLNFLAERRKKMLNEIQNAKKTATRGTKKSCDCPRVSITLCPISCLCPYSSFSVLK